MALHIFMVACCNANGGGCWACALAIMLVGGMTPTHWRFPAVWMISYS